MRARIGLAAVVFATAMGVLLAGGGGGPLDEGSQAWGMGGVPTSGGICLDGSQPYNGRCCVDHDCRSTYPAVGTLPSGSTFTRTTSLSGAEQSETSAGDPDGTGSATITAYPLKAQVCFGISHSNIEPTQAGHIHFGDRGANGPPVVNLYSSAGTNGGISGCTQADPATIQGLMDNPRGYYIQLHNFGYLLGVVRGQLGD